MLFERMGDVDRAAELTRSANVQAAALQAPVFHTSAVAAGTVLID
jgi:hypothetical protein